MPEPQNYTVDFQADFKMQYKDIFGTIDFTFEISGPKGPLVLYSEPNSTVPALEHANQPPEWVKTGLERTKAYLESCGHTVRIE